MISENLIFGFDSVKTKKSRIGSNEGEKIIHFELESKDI